MNKFVEALVEGFKMGARETPRGFFAPLIVFFRWMDRLTDEEVRRAGPWTTARLVDALSQSHRDLERTRQTMFERLMVLDPELHGLAVVAFGDVGKAATWMDQPLQSGAATPYQYAAAGNRARVIAALKDGARKM